MHVLVSPFDFVSVSIMNKRSNNIKSKLNNDLVCIFYCYIAALFNLRNELSKSKRVINGLSVVKLFFNVILHCKVKTLHYFRDIFT